MKMPRVPRFAVFALLTTLPLLLAWYIAAKRSWLPTVRRVYAEPVQELKFSSDGRQIIAVGLSEVKHSRITGMLNVNALAADTLEPARRLTRFAVNPLVDSTSLSPDLKTVAHLGIDNLDPNSGSNGPFNHLELLDAATGKVLWKRNPPSGDTGFSYFEFSPHGHWLAMKRMDAGILLYSLRTRQVITLKSKDLVNEIVYPTSFSEDERYLVTSSEWDGSLHVWNTATGQGLRALYRPILAHEPILDANSIVGPSYLALSTDGRLLASSYDEPFIGIWDFSSGKLRHMLRVSADVSATILAFSPDARILASGDDQGTIMLWDTQSGAKLRTMSLRQPKKADFEATPLEGTVPSPKLGLERKLTRGVTALTWSLDGSILFSGYDDGTVARWRIK